MAEVFTRKEVNAMIDAAVAEATAPLRERIAQLEAELARRKKDSSNSSKPPSSDIVKPPKPGGRGKRAKRRKRGGQPGHQRHERTPFPPDQIDAVWEYFYQACPDCGHGLENFQRVGQPVQQAEIVLRPIRVEEHWALSGWCPRCGRWHRARLPEEVRKAGLLGPRLTTLVAYMKGVCHASFSTIRKFLRDVVGIRISRGQLAKIIAKVSRSLAGAYQELLGLLPGEARLNVDETGHKENGEKYWTWCFRAELYTLFRIDKSRSSEVLVDVLGEEFDGVLGCDYFGAYRKYMRRFDVTLQFCLAHLIRDVKFLLTLPDRRTQSYGRRVREALRQLFAVIHRRELLRESTFRKRLEAARDEVLTQATKRVPPSKAAENLAERFRKHGEAYFRFITTPDVEPTNNLVEQAIRFVVIDRQITQGTRSERGRNWSERIWTTLATCTQQGRNVFGFLHQTILAHFHGQPPPSLLPNAP
jgi:transposase